MLNQTAMPTAQAIGLDTVKRHLVIDHTDDDLLIVTYIDSAVQWVEDYCNRALVQQSWGKVQSQFNSLISLNRLPVIAIDSINYLDSAGVEQTVPSYDYRIGLDSGRLSLAYSAAWPDVLPVDESISIAFQAGYLIPLSIDAETDTLSADGVGFADDKVIILSTNHTMPLGLSDKVPYFVVNSTGSSFQLSLTTGGVAVSIDDVGAGNCFAGTLSRSIQHALLLLVGHWYNNREQAIVGAAVNEIPLGVESLLANYRVITL